VSKLWMAGALVASAFYLLVPDEVRAQVVLPPATPQIGSSNTVSADPPVPRPKTRPCTVSLFTNLQFADFNTKNFSYTPPASCPGPWAKVVLTADFTVTAGRQFDRTAQFFLGGANIYFGTTAEPRADLSPSWHIERDVTDLSAVFRSVQAGTAILGNFVGVDNGVTFNGIIFANAQLVFYPASFEDRAPRVPDLVIGIPGNSGAATLNTSTDQTTQTVTLPTNVESAYVDVVAQSQANDEFWYFCVPNNLANALQSCGNTAFRETEVAIDGQPAGVAPIYPWIYTGGVDPFLWEPIPGVQTLNFKPYRVDLTPFAGVLSDGKQHTIAISVFNADSHFSVTGNLLLFTDHFAQKVAGGILSNTLAPAPSPVVTDDVTIDSSGNASGPLTVTSQRRYSITGYVETSHGRVETTVSQQISFSNTQNFTTTSTVFDQDLTQTTTVDARKTTREGFRVREEEKTFSYPFTFQFNQAVNADGSFSVQSISDQKFLEHDISPAEEGTALGAKTSNHVASQDVATFTAQGVRTSHTGSSSQSYVTKGPRGFCFSRSLTSINSVLTAFRDGAACHDDE
jgi:Peptide N-acetyl-beta-D-glucosaminyl asparaginase amidase A